LSMVAASSGKDKDTGRVIKVVGVAAAVMQSIQCPRQDLVPTHTFSCRHDHRQNGLEERSHPGLRSFEAMTTVPVEATDEDHPIATSPTTLG